MLPLDVSVYGKLISYFVYFLIGMGFGSVLELAGFGNSTKLAAQFYLKDMTVLKTMFTGILVACLLIFFSSAIGILDFSKIYVDETYLWPGILGGVIMGFGFILGGYCPGTSVVSAASLKLDGLFFFFGALIGVGLFGETVGSFQDFWHSSFTERLLLSDTFGWSIGTTVIGVTLLALMFFYGAEKTEEYFAAPEKPFRFGLRTPGYVYSSLAVLAISILIWAIGQPSAERKWDLVSRQYQPLLDSGDVFIHPLEYVKAWNDSSLKLVTLDFRSKEQFDQFHLDSAIHLSFDDLNDADFIFDLNQLPPQGLVVVVADKTEDAVRAWKLLKAQGAVNLYILDQGLAQWGQLFTPMKDKVEHFELSKPSAKILELFPKESYKPKIKLKTNKRAVGLCS